MLKVIKSFRSFFSDIFNKKKPITRSIPPREIEDLRLSFKRNYHHFKLLLNSNNKSLELMAEIEEMLKGFKPFGMTFIRSRVLRITTNVYQMIMHLNVIGKNRYEDLYPKFKEIQEIINQKLSIHKEITSAPLVVPLSSIKKEDVDLVGSKMANLGEVGNVLGLLIPQGFVLTCRAYFEFLNFNDLLDEIPRRLQNKETSNLDELLALSSEIQQLIINSKIPKTLEDEVQKELDTLKERDPNLRLAVRSSAIGEDEGDLSFAGQFRSELNVACENLFQAFKEVVASKYSIAAMTYRLTHGIKDEDIPMCVGCLEMIEAKASGVMYTEDPLNPRANSLVINSVFGLPKSIVDGTVTPDIFIVDKKEPLIKQKLISEKKTKYMCFKEEGVCRLEVETEERKQSSLSDEEILELANIGLTIERHFGHPQDIEWILDVNNRFWILQTRPLKIRLKEIKREDMDSSHHIVAAGGIPASSGIASGPAFVINQDADVFKFKEGSILVLSQAHPRFSVLLPRAKGVIAEYGSVAGHLANVAREFYVPAIFGLKDITKLVNTGQDITIDGDLGIVYDGKIQVIQAPEPKKGIMVGTPIYNTLKEISQLIIPLNLLDPESLEFKPKNCRTLHDITRFCHEKAVLEMFRFGTDHDFPERSSKQLLTSVPMQFWVLNLDDGFKREVEEKFISLDDIDSIPMKALWEGMIAIPWRGPPRLHTKGFMSVLLEATQNPALDPALASPYKVKNYFMISKNFCSLQSRFGFHFSIVETMVSERSFENYISFQFKGGAANLERRILRGRFIADILMSYGFKVDIKGDALFSRIEGYEKDFMVERLKLVGYLIIHTRQLDMIMSDPNMVSSYKIQIYNDIKRLLGEPPV